MNTRTRLTALVLALLMLISTPVSAWATTVDASTYAQWLQDAQTVSAQQQKLTTTSEEVLTTTDVTYSGTTTDRDATSLSLTGTAAEDNTLPQQSIILPVAGSATLHAPGGAESYQWQVYVSGVWANILGDTAASITMTYPMLSNALSGNSALVRCRMEQSGATVYSAETQVTVDHTITTTAYTTTQSIPVQATEYTTTRNANSGIMLLATEPQQTYLITIQYLFKDGTPAANPVIIQTGSSSGTQSYTGTVALPKVTGYDVDTPKDLPTGVTYNATNATLQFNNFSVTENKNITITYVPALVSYTVVYLQQKVGGDSDEDYKEVDRITTMQGYTGNTVATDLAPGDKYPGFRPLLYDTGTPIAADGSTVVNVKYDREYYLIKFNLDGGTGVDPIYAQFGAPYNVNEPTRAGYTFAGWDPPLPDEDERTIPYGGKEYTAKWTPAQTTYSVAYWLENANNDDYSLYKIEYDKEALSEDVVSSTTYDDRTFSDADYFDRNSSKDKNYTIKGDGSTVINVYYNRKVYTLLFYYARTKDTLCWVSTNTGGSSGKSSNDAYIHATWGAEQTSGAPALINLSDRLTTGSIVNANGYTYHYISLSAKYGAYIGDIWPTTANIATHGDYKFISWGTQTGTGYYINNSSNRNIKGMYPTMSQDIIKNKDKPSEPHTMVGYWNTAPLNYEYRIYYELLEDSTATEDIKTHNGKKYTHVNTFDTTSMQKEADQQTALTFDGVTFKERNPSTGDSEVIPGTDIRYVEFYYTRNPYTLTILDGNKQLREETVSFGASLESKEPSQDDLTPPSNHEFAGWYTSEDFIPGTEFDFEGKTMPAQNMTIYVKWVPVSHTVNVYLTKSDIGSTDPVKLLYHDNIEHGTLIPEDSRPSTPTNGEYKFVHWFYEIQNDDGSITEHPFDFASIPVIHDLNIYAKWSTDVVMNYKVYYVKKDSGEAIGDTTEFVADLSAGSALAGTSKTFYAKGVTELYPEYQTGWFPETQSHTISIGIDEDKNSYTFKYVPVDKVPYLVRYVDENGKNLRDPMTVSDNDKAVVTETFVLIPGYVPDALQKRLVVAYDASADPSTPTEANTITFVYEKDEKSAMYVINHYLVDSAGNETLHSYHTSTATMTSDNPATVKAETLNLTGYHFSEVKCEVAKDDNYTKFNETDLSVTMHQGSAGFVMNLYYQEDTATINYVVGNAYKSMGSLSRDTETLGVVTGEPAGSTPVASPGYKFVGWYSDADCTQPVLLGVDDNGALIPTRNAGDLWTNATYYAKFVLNVADLTITKVVKDAIATDDFHPDANTEFSFLVQIGGKNYVGGYTVAGQYATTNNGIISLKAGETASISDVTIGESYTVTEQTLPVGYTCKGNTVSGTINADSNAVTITNTYEVRSLTINKQVRGGDAPAGDVFDFVVSLPNGTYKQTNSDQSSDLTITDGKAIIRLSHGKTVVISGIPYGAAYTVTEVEHADYSTAVSGDSTGTLYDNASMTFTNTYLYSHLTVKKVGMTQGSAIVHIKVGNTTYSVVLNGENNWTQTIAHLPIGATIDVQEATDWSWRYSKAPTIVHADMVTEGGSTADITNTQAETKWLDDESAQTNIFSGSSN